MSLPGGESGLWRAGTAKRGRESERGEEMCGIAVVVSGVRIELSSVLPDHVTSAAPDTRTEELLLSVDEIKAALGRRGPDSLSSKDVLLHSKISFSTTGYDNIPFVDGDTDMEMDLKYSGDAYDSVSSRKQNSGFASTSYGAIHFIGATLQLRGINPIVQPLVDTSGNILVYNGEVFGGIEVGTDSNDAEVLLQHLASCSLQDERNCYSCGKNSVPELLSTIRGPWALIYWQVILSDFGDEGGMESSNFWEELSCAVYSISFENIGTEKHMFGTVKKHDWTNHLLKELIEWERTLIIPNPEEFCPFQKKTDCRPQDLCADHLVKMPFKPGPAQKVLVALKDSVMRQTALDKIYQRVTSDCNRETWAPIAVLFSGGVDSMILAALLDQCIDPKYEIDLLNVSFDGLSAPDRLSARMGVKELERNSPLRRWRLVEINAELSELALETKHVMSLINPANTYMDLNIGLALWLAAGGDGWLYDGMKSCSSVKQEYVKYRSDARILLVGSGADEQCAGYGRHKTKYRLGGWLGLHEEMRLDMQRIWKRNLGRDDRCIADNGKEARFPFLDENVIKTLLEIPLWEIADLDQPSGKGDKKILREVARLLGLHEAAALPKRAIQFGSRIARESNKKNFGSNRAANQASAGSAVISMP